MFDHENSTTSPIIWKRNRHQDLVIMIDFGALPKLLWQIVARLLLWPLFQLLSFILVNLDQATHKRTHLLIAAGLGIGVSMAMLVTFYPAYAQAQPEVTATQSSQLTRLNVERVRIPSMQIDAMVKVVNSPQFVGGVFSDSAVYQIGQASLSQQQTIVLQGFNSQLSFAGLTEAKLGQEIYLLASNNGWYRFAVVEIRYLPVTELPQVLSHNQETLVLYALQPFSQRVMVVVARPNR